MSEKAVTLPSDAGNTGKALRTVENTIGANVVDQEVVTLAKSDGTLLDSQLANLGNLDILLSAFRDAITNVAIAGNSLKDVVTALQANQPRTATQGPAGASAWKVDGSAVTQPVSGTFFQATQPVSGTVGVNNFPATQPVSGTVGVSNFPATQPVTDVNQDGAFGPTDATKPTLAVLIGGSDGQNLRSLRAGSDGLLKTATDDAMLTELRMIRQGIGLLLNEFSSRVDLTQLNELEAI